MEILKFWLKFAIGRLSPLRSDKGFEILDKIVSLLASSQLFGATAAVSRFRFVFYCEMSFIASYIFVSCPLTTSFEG